MVLKKGCKLQGDEDKLILKKGDFMLAFNQEISKGDSFLLEVMTNLDKDSGMCTLQHGRQI